MSEDESGSVSGGRALEIPSLVCVDAQSGPSWVEVRFIGLALMRDREAREGEADDDILLRLASNCCSTHEWFE